MTEREFQMPTLGDLYQRIIRGGRTQKQFFAMYDVLQSGIERGNLRDEISCWESKEKFFDIVRRSYDSNTQDQLNDVECSIHLFGCDYPLCKRLLRAYFERPAATAGKSLVETGADYLESIASEIILAKELPELRQQESNWIDSSTGLILPITKAVDITEKCLVEEEESRQLLYLLTKRESMVDMVKLSSGLPQSRILLSVNAINPLDRSFSMHSELFGLDAGILAEVIKANAPESQDQ